MLAVVAMGASAALLLAVVWATPGAPGRHLAVSGTGRPSSLGVPSVGTPGTSPAGTGPAGAGTSALGTSAPGTSTPGTSTAVTIAAGTSSASATASTPPSGPPSPTGTPLPFPSIRPAPTGTFAQYNLPAPWIGGTSPWANVWVYTPAGYRTSSPARYPVLYEVPWGGDGWESGIHVRELLDTLIADGTLPPTLMVFINQARGPYRPSECADSWDGREHFDTYVAQTVVPWVDAHFRTLRTPLARTLVGFSQGGYCAPTLLFHHPDLFASAVSFSGYFVAGVWSPDTRLAHLPFGGNATLIANDSPVILAGRLPSAVRTRLFLVLVGTPGEAFYGPQLESFSGTLAAGGYQFVVLDSAVGHSWRQVRVMFAAALAAVTQRQAQAGLVTPRG